MKKYQTITPPNNKNSSEININDDNPTNIPPKPTSILGKATKFAIGFLVEASQQYSLLSMKAMSCFHSGQQKIDLEIWNGFYLTKNTTNQLDIDLATYRSPAVKKPLIDALYSYYKRLLINEQKLVAIPTEKQLLDIMTKTALVYDVDYKGEKAVVDLSVINHLGTFQGNYNIVKAEFDKEYLYQDIIS